MFDPVLGESKSEVRARKAAHRIHKMAAMRRKRAHRAVKTMPFQRAARVAAAVFVLAMLSATVMVSL